MKFNSRTNSSPMPAIYTFLNQKSSSPLAAQVGSLRRRGDNKAALTARFPDRFAFQRGVGVAVAQALPTYEVDSEVT